MVRSEDCKSSQFGAFSVRSRNLSGFMCESVCLCVEGFHCTESHTHTHVYEQNIINVFTLDHAAAGNPMCHDMGNFDMQVRLHVCV